MRALSDPTSRPLYICTESALMISPLRRSASCSATAVLPTAVGPVTMITRPVCAAAALQGPLSDAICAGLCWCAGRDIEPDAAAELCRLFDGMLRLWMRRPASRRWLALRRTPDSLARCGPPAARNIRSSRLADGS